MKKNFLFKGVLVLGAMLLLATSVMPGLQYAVAQEAQQPATPSYDLILNAESYAALYADNETLLGELNTYNAGEGAENFPWVVIKAPEGGFAGNIVFEYDDQYEESNAKAPFGKHITIAGNTYLVKSIPVAFSDENLEDDGFDSTKLTITYVPETITELTQVDGSEGNWYYVNSDESWGEAYGDETNQGPLRKYYTAYPTENLWHITANRVCSASDKTYTLNIYSDLEGTELDHSGFFTSDGGEYWKITNKANADEVYYIHGNPNNIGNNVYELYQNVTCDLPVGVPSDGLTLNGGYWLCNYKGTTENINEIPESLKGVAYFPSWSDGYTYLVDGVYNTTSVNKSVRLGDLEYPEECKNSFNAITNAPWIVGKGLQAQDGSIFEWLYKDGDEPANRISIEEPAVTENANPENYRMISLPGTFPTVEDFYSEKFSAKLINSNGEPVVITKADHQFTVTFSEDGVEEQTVELGLTAIEPTPAPTKDGFAFVAWQVCTGEEPTCEDFDFDTPITADTTLTAKWASTAWEMYAIHALPLVGGTECNDMGGGNQCKANSADGTYTTADGTYTIKNSDHTITYSEVTINDPGAQNNDNGERPEGYVRFGVRFLYPEAITDGATFKGKNFCDGEDNCYFKQTNGYVDSRGQALSSSQLQELINNGTKTKEWEIKASWNGTEEDTFKVVLDLENVEIKDTSDNSVIKVEDYKVVSLGGEPAYTITFNTNGGSAVASISAKAGAAVTAPANPTKNGYTFAGWDTPIPTTMPANDMTIKAKWTSKSTSSGGGGGSSSYSCKNLPDNAVKNNSTTPKSNTNYSYSTDTTKVCTFQCKSGYAWNEKTTKCEKSDASDTTKTDETKTDENANNNEGSNNDGSNGNGATAEGFSQEFIDAYNFAHKNGITTKESIDDADMYGPLTRIAMAKMLSQYAINVLGQKPDTSKVVPNFPDVDAQLDADYNNGVTLAYQLGIMGIGIQEFRPFAEVTRAEFGTALSRMLFGTADGEGNEWYKTHLDKLMLEKIITNDDPNLKELRGYVMIMLMRSASDK